MAYKRVGLSAALGDLRLGERGRGSRPARTTTFAPTGLDDELLRAADAAVASRTPLAFVLPFPAPAAAVHLAAATILGTVAANRGSDVSVAVAATHLSNVITYDHLYLRSEQLSALIPRVRVTTDGSIRGHVPASASGRLYVSGALRRLGELLGSIDGLVIDASAVTGDDLDTALRTFDRDAARTPRPAVLYLTSNPLDPNLDTLRRHDGLVWAWDAPSAYALASTAGAGGADSVPVTVPGALLTVAGQAAVTVTAPSRPTPLDESLATLWRALGELLDAQPRGPGDIAQAGAARWAWAMYHVAAACPVSAGRYDQHVRVNPYYPAGRLADAPLIAREYAKAAFGKLRSAWFNVAAAFTDVVEAGASQQKLAALIAWINDRVAADEPGVVIVPNTAMVAAVRAALAESPQTPDRWDAFIAVGTRRDLPNFAGTADGTAKGTGQGPVLCLLAGVPRSAAALLAAPPAALTIVAAGPAEAARVTRAALEARAALSKLRWETTELTANLLDVAPNSPYSAGDPAWAVLQNTLDTLAGTDGEGSPWEPLTLDMLALLQQIVAEPDTEASPPGVVTDGAVALEVDAVVLHLERRDQSGSANWRSVALRLDPNDLVARQRGERLDRVAAKALAPDDIILLVDDDGRRDLLTAVIAKLSESTTYATLAGLVAFWHDRAALAKTDGQTYRSILDRMSDTTVTSETTIGSWVRADVTGPQDKANVARFAQAVRDPFLLAEAERVAWALTFLHRVHRKVGAWLSAQIRGTLLTATDATIDAALDIQVADLLDAVTGWRVTKVESSRQATAVPLLGVLQPNGANRVC